MGKPQTSLETATIAGGCFWCLEAVFQRLKGVQTVVSGYTGGITKEPKYEDLHSGETGHAEAVQVTFDASVISYEQILDIFWHMHDPTTLNRQGNDVGTQYRSSIFYHSELQKSLAIQSMKKAQTAKLYPSTFVTQIVPLTTFYPAENYHQNYYNNNSYQRYCQYVIDPKLRKLFAEYRDLVKSEDLT